MKKAVAKIDGIVQIPIYEFEPMRSGWNGWLFQVGIVKGLGKSKKTGKLMIKVEYPSRDYAQKFTDLRGEQKEKPRLVFEKWFNANCVFETSLWNIERQIQHPREYWSNGCYDANTEFLIDKGII